MGLHTGNMGFKKGICWLTRHIDRSSSDVPRLAVLYLGLPGSSLMGMLLHVSSVGTM